LHDRARVGRKTDSRTTIIGGRTRAHDGASTSTFSGCRSGACTSTFSGCKLGRCSFAQLIDLLFHLKAREPLDVAWHVSRRIHAALSASSRKILPVLDDLRTGIVFRRHTAFKRLLSLGAKYSNEGFFRCPASYRDIDGWHPT
jgi:hypothetical protein